MKKIIWTATLMALLLVSTACSAELRANDTVIFGHYEQNNSLTDGPEPIEWRVMEIDADGDAMLISRYVLDKASYNLSNTKASWRKSTLRTWLNTEFYDAAFTDEEKAQIVTKEVTTRYDAGSTADPVTLMTCPDALRIFQDHPDRQCEPTVYALARGVYQSKKYAGYTHWWTRNPSWEAANKASYVAASGGTMKCGAPLTNPNYGVRPVIYLKAADFTPAEAQ